MKNVTILAVGIGGFANNYLSKMLPDHGNGFEIVGAVEPYPESCKCLDEFKAKNIPIYSDIDEFYAHHNADLAIICSPIFLHTRQTLTALKNGSNVMCEKPLSGVSADAELIEEEAKKQGKFVMTGYQWSYSDAILDLKRDILDGMYGKPVMMKTMILWPRDTNYFKRGSGWAGKLKAPDGTVINDSVAANATAHYLHNILYVTGKEHFSSEALNVKADLLRVNNIENFDTAVVSFDLDCGGKGLFVASHSTDVAVNPIFEYRFENGIVTYSEDEGVLRGRLTNGEEKLYGSPSVDVHTKKIYEAIRGCNVDSYRPVCSPYTAAAHVRCIEEIQKEKIHQVNAQSIRQRGDLLFIDGLDNILKTCYDEERMPRETVAFKELI